ncbi:hypothetical protein Osc7112_5656 [Oscillatoria nigro-viridis PCC 7112]|uniref:Uncharacterized protein n=1 Tax=Phormidium nigroviride PCC 7112 TaxID=179408 RepID=K9VQU4_9CYAN|nr:hypothetical protein Osc7112_5656 [Oscillatoria nigro-viridis PCC 7112]
MSFGAARNLTPEQYLILIRSVIGGRRTTKHLRKQSDSQGIAILASFVNFLLPPRGFGEGWGGVKNLRLIYDCYITLHKVLI